MGARSDWADVGPDNPREIFIVAGVRHTEPVDVYCKYTDDDWKTTQQVKGCYRCYNAVNEDKYQMILELKRRDPDDYSLSKYEGTIKLAVSAIQRGQETVDDKDGEYYSFPVRANRN
ncbi:unnamed protein product [Didymodactylos carnosus]|uniref:Uncharacterized protein n=1 Tax=Didymodactylos carnosus TaxID=1234261 RepID=A0A814UZM1_9BILA|nr:unnamed protein product [Didymodactylos carnosus]CAF3942897.1 unnamed protein product [Didymodactylos carnosus]